MWQRDRLGGALLVEDIATVPAVVFPICEGEGRSTPHANIAVCPLGRRATVDHAARDFDFRREFETLFLKTLIDRVDI